MKKPWTLPILRWAGSKRKLLPILLANAPPHYKRYIEPFCGSACLFFALHPPSAILSDINVDLINTYKILVEHPRLLSRLVHNIPNTSDDYLAYRKKLPSELTPIEMAARFIYLNRHCFNGVYRTNKKGEFNVPRGSRTGILPSEAFFYRTSHALRNSLLFALDFEKCLNHVKYGDFVYLDPPYATSDKPSIEEYGPNTFQKQDITRLIRALFRIDDIGASFILSYIYSKEVLSQLNPAWNIKEVIVQRHVAGFSQHREKVKEILISNRYLT